MIVPDEVRKCVVFIGYSMADGEKVFVGSGFFIGRKIVGEIANEIFLITAKHVIKKIKDFGLDQVFLRVNLKDGTSGWYPTKLSEWKTHPNDPTIDIAFLKCGIPHYFLIMQPLVIHCLQMRRFFWPMKLDWERRFL